ncbi:hypothetical protein [Bradyrhizobium sp. CB2312]|uniref:hypothetical protein n=2 Tax=unclassified Bradyrhizobium TaxID=2631580 RepID=UPI0024B1D3D1|nr:hypothetical protein [Bradyrhizobium sp. CB2312]WFU70271.1 hypothetical protein QA642_34095 [Bradyrhizobium sp. CB2312]
MPGLFVIEAFAMGMAARPRETHHIVDLDQAGHGAAWPDTASTASHGSPSMWVLMYVFSYSVSPAATNDKAEWRLLPTVVFQEFSNEERCRAAKTTLESSLSHAGERLKSGLEDLKSLGKADPSQIIIAYNVECLPK